MGRKKKIVTTTEEEGTDTGTETTESSDSIFETGANVGGVVHVYRVPADSSENLFVKVYQRVDIEKNPDLPAVHYGGGKFIYQLKIKGKYVKQITMAFDPFAYPAPTFAPEPTESGNKGGDMAAVLEKISSIQDKSNQMTMTMMGEMMKSFMTMAGQRYNKEMGFKEYMEMQEQLKGKSGDELNIVPMLLKHFMAQKEAAPSSASEILLSTLAKMTDKFAAVIPAAVLNANKNPVAVIPTKAPAKAPEAVLPPAEPIKEATLLDLLENRAKAKSYPDKVADLIVDDCEETDQGLVDLYNLSCNPQFSDLLIALRPNLEPYKSWIESVGGEVRKILESEYPNLKNPVAATSNGTKDAVIATS